jgi:hypothetical protein
MRSDVQNRNNYFITNRRFLRVFLRVHFLQYLFPVLVVGLSLLSGSALAQDEPQRRGSRIIDDTTKQVYGPKTSNYFFEEDVLLNRPVLYRIDTAIRNFHQFNYVQRHDNLYQDLGNMGTAIRPIYYQVPEVIGVTSGFNAYDLYWDEEKVRYFDTKSPYSNMKLSLGGRGRSITRVTYSRNINPRWNVGFNYRGLFVDKQIQRQGKGDRNVRSNYYDIYTTFISKDSATYRLFFNFRRDKHETDEYGGVSTDDDFQYEQFFFTNAQPSLTEASSTDLRMNFHLFHQYQVGSALQVYHIFDRYRQGNGFSDKPASEPTDYYDYTEIDSTVNTDQVKFKYVRNEVGIKGNLLKLFYNGYYAIRQYSMNYNYLDEDTLRVKASGTEHYLGGRISLRLDSLVEVTARAELLQTGNYRLEGHIKSKWFEATVKQVQYAPSFLQQGYRGSHDVWNNDFSDVNVTTINGYLHYNSRVLSLSPGATFTRIGNYVFFKEDDYGQEQTVLPIQTGGEQVFLLPELRVSLTIAKHIHIRGRGIYTELLNNTGQAMQLPKVFVNGQISYENIFFNGNLDMHAGVDLHYKPAYRPLGYDVPIQQFYVQQTFESPEFPLIDIFLNAKIKRGRIFVKYNNLLQLITKQGYMPTPLYPGQGNIVDFGFDWSFYD